MLKRLAILTFCITAALALTTAGTAGAVELVGGESVQVEITEAGGYVVASIEVPEESATLVVDLAVAEGALGLAVNPDSAPDPADPAAWAQSLAPASGQLVLSVDMPAAGVWYVLVYGEAPGAGTLTATTGQGGLEAEAPENNDWNQGNLAAGESLVYSMELPAGTNFFKANLHTSLGSATLYTKFGAVPTEGDNDCIAHSESGNAQCRHHFPEGGTWYAMVTAHEDSMVNVQLHYTENQKEVGDPDLDGTGPPSTPPGQDKDKDNNGKNDKNKTPPGQSKKK